MNRARHLLQSTLIVIILFGLDKVIGFVRTIAVSAAFGTTPVYDAFTAANQLPELFVTLISGGALAAAFIPVYSQHLTSPRAREAGRLASSTLTLVVLVLGVISAAGALFAPWLARTLLVPDFSPEQQQLTAGLMRIILLQTTLFGISGVLSGILNAHQHFVLPALAPVALNLGYFIGLYAFIPAMDGDIHGLALGTVAGGVLHILIQVPALLRYRFRYRPQLGLSLPGVREIIRLMGPRIVTLGAIQFADLFIIRLTSGLPPGSTSGYFYAYYLQQLPETLFGTAIGIVVFPTLAELYNSGRIDELKRTAMNALKIVWTLTIPAGALLVLLGRPAIALVMERGQFDAQSTALVYSVLVFFSVRVVAEATLEIVARLFYAQHNTVTPMAAALVWLVVTVALLYLFVDDLGVGGLALATTVGFTVQSALLLYLNRRKLGSLDERGLLQTMGRALVATALLAATVLGVQAVVESSLGGLAAALSSAVGLLDAGAMQSLLFVGFGGLAGLVVYVLANLLLGGREIPALLRLIRPRVAAAPTVPPAD
ncbi:MAG: murein biosynthesis integral membrane protein MurJ [Chloroflexi bacterium]|nr:murein biosynthesis integral membrane protein MurJ [Chloroflexota bacterium]